MIDSKEIVKYKNNINQHGDHYVAQLTIQSDLKYFEGHFPNNPILPAVCFIDASLEYIRQINGNPILSIFKIKSAKFLGVVLPNDEITLKLVAQDKHNWTITWLKGSETVCDIILTTN